MPAELAMTETMRSSHQRSRVGERDAGLLLLGEPGGVVLVHSVSVGNQLVVGADGVADQRDQVGEGVGGAASDVRGLDGDVGVPDDVGGPVVRRPGDPVGELLDVGEVDPALGGLVGELDGGDLVAVLVEVGAPGLDDRLGAVGVDDAAGFEELVLADLVDDPVVGAAQLEDPVAQLGVGGDRFDRRGRSPPVRWWRGRRRRRAGGRCRGPTARRRRRARVARLR